jgi:hypothetical protein
MDQAQQARRPVAQLGRAVCGWPAAQHGWVGLVVILVALVIVALLAQTALKGYGLLPESGDNTRAGNRVPPAASPASVDPTSVPATPAATMERARGLEQQLQRDAREQTKRIDDSTQ